MEIERITHVACIFADSMLLAAPAPARHSDLIRQHVQLTDKQGSGRQGFMTTRWRFVDRFEAARIARAANQTKTQAKNLYSEDLW